MITRERLKEVLHYDPLTGIWTWLVCLTPRYPVGSVAGGINSQGYWRIRVDGRHYSAHRLAVLYMTGEWPKATVDHGNRNRLDNRWENLEDVSHQQQNFNRGPIKRTTPGVTGLYLRKKTGKWEARIFVGGRMIQLGAYREYDQALSVRRGAEIEHFGVNT